jgi:hypothetical protein
VQKVSSPPDATLTSTISSGGGGGGGGVSVPARVGELKNKQPSKQDRGDDESGAIAAEIYS